MSSSRKTRSASTRQLAQPWTDEMLKALVPLPDPTANKYSRGKLTVVAGSRRYPGAACLASRAGQRTGAGYAEVVTDADAKPIVIAAAPSLVVRSFEDWSSAELSNLKRPDRQAVCIGPGFVPGSALSDELVVGVLKQATCPVLVDGGGLRALGSKKALKALAKRRERDLVTVITPHEGEAVRLCKDLRASSGAADELAAVLAMATGAIAVVKGPDTYISAGKDVIPMSEGTPALAKAGTGDVLAGMIAALLAQGIEPVGAAVLGTTLHARAGIAAAERHTEIAVTPEDVIEAIPDAIHTLSH